MHVYNKFRNVRLKLKIFKSVKSDEKFRKFAKKASTGKPAEEKKYMTH